jgi:uncharacterized protein with HEPN domain
MSRRDDRNRLLHMLDHAREALATARGRSRVDLDEDRLFNLAMVRLVEIIVEAAARVTPETRYQIPQIPWDEVVGFRNRVIHGYDRVDFDILWATVVTDLPPLISALGAFLSQ